MSKKTGAEGQQIGKKPQSFMAHKCICNTFITLLACKARLISRMLTGGRRERESCSEEEKSKTEIQIDGDQRETKTEETSQSPCNVWNPVSKEAFECICICKNYTQAQLKSKAKVILWELMQQ